MAGLPVWKQKTSREVKAMLKHDDKELRKTTNHDNPHINKDLTDFNINLDGKTYEQRCAHYDNKIKELDKNPKNNKRKDRVTCVGIEIIEPKGLDPDLREVYFRDMTEAITGFYNQSMDDVIGADVHVDEIHDYIDPATREKTSSRAHCVLRLIPEVDGRLNAKEFTKRKNLIDLNKLVQEKTQELYGLDYTNLEKAGLSSKKTVEQLKAESYALQQAEEIENNEKRLSQQSEKIESNEEKLFRQEKGITHNNQVIKQQNEDYLELTRRVTAKKQEEKKLDASLQDTSERLSDASERLSEVQDELFDVNNRLASQRALLERETEDWKQEADKKLEEAIIGYDLGLSQEILQTVITQDGHPLQTLVDAAKRRVAKAKKPQQKMTRDQILSQLDLPSDHDGHQNNSDYEF